MTQPGVRVDGEVRTDTSLDYSSPFRDTFTLITCFQLPWGAQMLPLMQQNLERTNPGQDRITHVSSAFFPLRQNHRDMFFPAIETSSVADELLQ